MSGQADDDDDDGRVKCLLTPRELAKEVLMALNSASSFSTSAKAKGLAAGVMVIRIRLSDQGCCMESMEQTGGNEAISGTSHNTTRRAGCTQCSMP